MSLTVIIALKELYSSINSNFMDFYLFRTDFIQSFEDFLCKC